MSSWVLKFLRGFMLIRSVILAILAFVAAVLIAVNYVWKGEWSKERFEWTRSKEAKNDQ